MSATATTAINLDLVFSSLSDKTRRVILARVLERPRTIGELAGDHMKLSLAAVSKHVGVLEGAKLVTKKTDGNFRVISANPKTITAATQALEQYKAMLDGRFNKLEQLLKS